MERPSSQPSSHAAAGAVFTGSHTDAIPLAGAYDGTLGVIGAIAALKALKEAGFKPERPIDALMFTSEEPTRFGLGCIGRWVTPYTKQHRGCCCKTLHTDLAGDLLRWGMRWRIIAACAATCSGNVVHAARLGCSCAELEMRPLHCLPAEPPASLHLHAAVSRAALAS